MKVAVITARGGSKRIPRKNVKEFCGKPILLYSIEAALHSGLFDEVMVSTEDREIAELAEKAGASVPFMRSEENAGDFASTASVLEEVVREYAKRNKSFEWLCCIYPTAPFITAEKLKDSYEKLVKQKADALIPVVRFSYPPQRCFVVKEEQLAYKWPEYTFSRSQDLEPYYHDAGQYYFIKTEALLKTHTLVPEHTAPYMVDEMEVQDIDNLDDWRIAEMKYKARKKADR